MEIKSEIPERLKPLNPEKIILFGSYAYGTPNKDSDLSHVVVFYFQQTVEKLFKPILENRKINFKKQHEIRGIR